jgi:phosphoenolpyruvate synthase/pyruvate phosphate dikinase
VAEAMLDSGAAAYIAPVGPNHGYRNLMEAQEAIENRLCLGDVLRSTIARKLHMTVRTGAGVRSAEVPEAWRSDPTLDAARLRELARLAALVQAHYGAPQDIEWAEAAGEFYILQSRPITTLAHTR